MPEKKRILIRLCCGINCSTHGGQEILDLLETDPQIKGNVKIECVECMDDKCDQGNASPVIEIEGKIYLKMTSDRLMDMLHGMIARK